MIKVLSPITNKDLLVQLVNIHKKCILKINSKVYSNIQIEEWLSSINIENIQDQLKDTSWIILEVRNNIVGFAQYSIEDKEFKLINTEIKIVEMVKQLSSISYTHGI